MRVETRLTALLTMRIMGYRCFQSGLRFSTKAFMPSF
jgi:hypothetical protein